MEGEVWFFFFLEDECVKKKIKVGNWLKKTRSTYNENRTHTLLSHFFEPSFFKTTHTHAHTQTHTHAHNIFKVSIRLLLIKAHLTDAPWQICTAHKHQPHEVSGRKHTNCRGHARVARGERKPALGNGGLVALGLLKKRRGRDQKEKGEKKKKKKKKKKRQ